MDNDMVCASFPAAAIERKECSRQSQIGTLWPTQHPLHSGAFVSCGDLLQSSEGRPRQSGGAPERSGDHPNTFLQQIDNTSIANIVGVHCSPLACSMACQDCCSSWLDGSCVRALEGFAETLRQLGINRPILGDATAESWLAVVSGELFEASQVTLWRDR